jgi:hypothetical protein
MNHEESCALRVEVTSYTPNTHIFRNLRGRERDQQKEARMIFPVLNLVCASDVKV